VTILEGRFYLAN